MAIEPRAALDRLIGALEDFHQVAINAPYPEAPSVLEASDAVVNAYTVYDDVLFTQFGVEIPLDVYSTDDLDDDDFDADFDDEDEDSDDEDSDDFDDDDLDFS